MNINVIIAAAGTSQRYGTENKLFEKCGSTCVLLEAIKPFLAFQAVKKVVVSTDSTYFDELMGALSATHLDEDGRIKLSIGGKSRTETVKNALSSLSDDCDVVLVHDGARPFVSTSLISSVIDNLKSGGAVVPLVKLTDNIAGVENGVLSLNRENYRGIQTPMAFDRNVFERAYKAVDGDYLDDLAVVQKFAPCPVVAVDGEKSNVKITTKDDLKDSVVGCGYDIHRLEKGKGIRLLGTYIPCPYSLVAHSDGDVPIHAIMDAILSAIGEKDIGHLFPVDDARYDGADSMQLLDEVLSIAKGKGYAVSNVTVAIIAEKPILAPYIDEMRARVACALAIPNDKVGITATTNEKVGDIGNGNAIAAYATVLLH